MWVGAGLSLGWGVGVGVGVASGILGMSRSIAIYTVTMVFSGSEIWLPGSGSV